MTRTLYVVSNDGEVEQVKELTDDQKIKITTTKQEEYLKHKEKSDDLCSQVEAELGGFCWVIYYNNELFDNKIDVKHIARIIYLATFLEYDTNRLVFHEQGRSNKPFTEQDLKEKLGFLDNKTYNNFKKQMVKSGILIFEEAYISMSAEFFHKGSIAQHDKQIKVLGGSYSRLYVNTIRALYEGLTDTRQHKTLGYLFQLLPYCDYEYNIITRSPNTEEAYEEVLTKKDIAELLGIGEDAFKRIEKQLRKLIIKVRDVEYYVIGKETLEFGSGEDIKTYQFYVVNPLIFNCQRRDNFTSLARIWRKLKR